LKHLRLLFLISIISGQIACKDKREYDYVGSFISVPTPKNDKTFRTDSDKRHDPCAVFGSRKRTINDYASKRSNSSLYSRHLNYSEHLEYQRLEKLYGNNLRKYNIEFKSNNARESYEDLFGPSSILTLKPEEQITREANQYAKLTRKEIDYYALGLNDKSNNNTIHLDFAECGLFYNPEVNFTIKVWECCRPNWLTKYAFSEQKIFSMFTDFYNYASSEYIKDLRLFPCFDRFMRDFAKQLKTNPEFKRALEGMHNGQEIIDFIQNEADRINKGIQHNQQVINKHNQNVLNTSSIAKELTKLKQQFESELKQDPSHKAEWQARIKELEKTNLNHSKFYGNYKVSSSMNAALANKLNINPANLLRFNGNFLQHQLHKESVSTINIVADLWQKHTSPEFREFLESTILTSHLSICLNRASKVLEAARFNNAAKDLAAVAQGIDVRYKQFGKDIGFFLQHPFDTTLNKCDEIAKSTGNAVISLTKAFAFLLGNVPASHGIPTPHELKKLDNIDRKAQELGKFCDYVSNYLKNAPREEKFKTLGYTVTDFIFSMAEAQAGMKVLSTSGKALKSTIAASGRTLKKLGPIGDEVAKLTGLAIDKGVKATETLLDIAKHQSELVTAEGGVFKFVENALEKEQKVASGFAEVAKDVVKAEKFIEKFNSNIALKRLKSMLVKSNGEAIGDIVGNRTRKIFRTLPGTETDAKAFFEKLVEECGLSHLIKESKTKLGKDLFMVDKPGFGSISYRPISESGFPCIGIDIPEFKGIIQKIKFN
jgi:hypothetical protein